MIRPIAPGAIRNRIPTLAAALLLGGLVARAAAAADLPKSEECLACHADKSLTRGAPFLDPEAVIEPATVAGEAGVRYRRPLNVYHCLIEWKFAHAGWLYTAGALVRKPDDEFKAESRAQDVLSTWQWLD